LNAVSIALALDFSVSGQEEFAAEAISPAQDKRLGLRNFHQTSVLWFRDGTSLSRRKSAAREHLNITP
jgi:hypothetical protein